jgi:hypothetical protein
VVRRTDKSLSHDHPDNDPCESGHNDIACEHEREEEPPPQIAPRSGRLRRRGGDGFLHAMHWDLHMAGQLRPEATDRPRGIAPDAFFGALRKMKSSIGLARNGILEVLLRCERADPIGPDIAAR